MLWGFKNSNQNNIIYILIKIVNILKTYKLSWNCWHLLDGRLMQSTCSFYVCFILQMYVHRGFIHTDVCSTKFHTSWCMFWVYRNPLLNFFRRLKFELFIWSVIWFLCSSHPVGLPWRDFFLKLSVYLFMIYEVHY